MLKTVTNIIDASQIKTPITFVGDVTLSTGNLVIGTSGKGIDFSATSSGSGTMTSELLADYEEGTWTPSVGGTATYSVQSGTYTKIGRQVTVNFAFQINLILTGSTSSISGLPFTVGADDGCGSVRYFASLSGNVYSLGCYAASTTTTIYLPAITAATATTNSPQSTLLQNSSYIIATVTYFV